MNSLKRNISNMIVYRNDYESYKQSEQEVCNEIANIFSEFTQIPRENITAFSIYLKIVIAFFNPETLTNNAIIIDLGKIITKDEATTKEQILDLIAEALAKEEQELP